MNEEAPRQSRLPPHTLAFAAQVAIESGNWGEASRLMQSVDETHLDVPTRAIRRTGTYPYAALALAKSGDIPGARALIASTPADCYDCVWARGAIAAVAGDAAGSDRWFANAVRQGPSLPLADLEWGRAKLARRDADGAIALFEQAHRKGPRWADPLKYWGDALAFKRDYSTAAQKFAQAAERAPRWGALHLAWGQALAKQNRAAEAQARYRAAAEMDLSRADRILLAELRQSPKG